MLRSMRTVVVALALTACKGPGPDPVPDAGPIDSGAHDATAGDASSDASSDAGTDAGTDAASDAASSATEPASLAGITAAHNAARANASPTPTPSLAPLVWSSTLANAAQTWADGCVFAHSGNGYGENIYASTGTPTGSGVVSSWVSEASAYDYATNTCSSVCGHYTQVVWRSTTSLGCGIRACSTGSPFDVSTYGPNWTLVVCDYDPPGNDGSRPY